MNKIPEDNFSYVKMSSEYADNIEALRDIIPNNGTQVQVKGALSVGDGGEAYGYLTPIIYHMRFQNTLIFS
ncbi:hypothetical protein AB9K36_24330 [Klebsiella michiganensis]